MNALSVELHLLQTVQLSGAAEARRAHNPEGNGSKPFSRGTLIIDGAFATELEARGHDLNHPLWSAKMLREDPQAIETVHTSYYLAGADIAITASYQASIPGFHEHLGLNEHKAKGMIKNSASLASMAREMAKPAIRPARILLVAGSIGPYGAYLADGSEYRGDYQRTVTEFQEFHRPRIAALERGGADLLAIETMPQLAEIKAVLQLLQAEFPRAICWVSCTLRHSKHLSDGTPLQELVKVVEQYRSQVVAVGINCVPTHIVADALSELKNCTDLPILCYPNSGEVYEATTNTWSGTVPSDIDSEKQIQIWRDSGARLIGGCCRTGPNFIKMVHRALQEST